MVWKVIARICEIFTRALTSLKIGTLMGSFYPKNDAKFEKELTCRFKLTPQFDEF